MVQTIILFAIISVVVPIIGSFLSLLLKKLPTVRDFFSVSTIAVSAIMSILIFGTYKGETYYLLNWLNWGDNKSGIYLDSLSVLMVLIVSILSMLIAFFSIEYMKEDKHKARYWFFIQMFVGGMLLLVLAHDMVFLFLGWEIVGLCSCFLIGHFFMKKGKEGEKPAKSGIKALIMTGIGDVGLLAFLAWMYYENKKLGLANPLIIDTTTPLGGTYPIVMSVLLLLAPITKSAQFPLQSWLSSGDTVDIDAMQGPTTVSALIHAATMVKAGIYLVARFSPIWDSEFFYIALMIIAGVSCVAAAFGALVTTDLKRVLAYSTISQLSYMFLAFTIREDHGTGLIPGQMHLLSHSIFKALLFLSAGAIIHSIAEERDMKKMGGLKKDLPWVYGFMMVGVLGLIGIPIITNGGYSKEMIITAAYEAAAIDGASMHWFTFIVGILVAFLTTLYAARMFLMIFHGKNRGARVHKPKYIMRIVLAILAVLVVATGFIIEGPASNFFTGDTGYSLIHVVLVPFLCAIGAIILGLGLAYLFYGKGQTEVGFVEKINVFKALRTFVANGFYIDHFYNLVFVKPIFWIGQKLSFFKTGKINWNMIFGSVVAIFIVIATLLVVMV